MDNITKIAPRSPNYWAVIPAAGISSRMQSDIPKQYLALANNKVIAHTINRLLAADIFSKIIVVLHQEDNHFNTINIANKDKILTTTGGAHRYNSVLNGVNKIQEQEEYNYADWVLVHDAARPCITIADIIQLTTALKDDALGGILGYQAVDTIKKVIDNKIVDTPKRDHFWHALTPQMFRFDILLTALNNIIKNNLTVTDESSAVELLGYKPKIIPGRSDNIKITHTADIELAEYYLDKQKME